MTRQDTNRTISHFLLLPFLFLFPCVLSAQGFYDDFSDGNAKDGEPVTWFEQTGTFTVDAGDNLVLHADPTLGWATATVPELIFGDASIRTQVRMTNGSLVGLAGRYVPPGGARSCYSAGLESDGLLAIGQCGVPNSYLAQRQTDLDPTQEDVMIQFDMMGTSLSLWAWLPSEPMPVEPLISVEDNTLQSGEVLVSVIGDLATAEYRFVQVDTKHIPEPSSLSLVLTGVLGVLPFRRRR